MALTWNWNESVGTAVIESKYEDGVKEIPITLLVKAFDNIDIEIYSEEE